MPKEFQIKFLEEILLKINNVHNNVKPMLNYQRHTLMSNQVYN